MTNCFPACGCRAPTSGRATRIVLLVRRSEAFWRGGHIEPSLIVRDPDKAARVSAAVAWWDRTFWLGYRDFRLALRDLAAPLHWRAGFDDVIPWQDEQAVRRQPPGTWLVPVDEDDWLCPGFAGRLRGPCAEAAGHVVTWDVVRKSAEGVARLNPNAFVESCGYAVRLPFGWTPICSHMHLPPPPRRSVNEALSVRNETPASMAFLYRNPTGQILPTLRNALAGTNDGIPAAFHDVWERYRDLLARLSASLQQARP